MMLVDRERSLLLRTHCFPMLTILSLFCQCSNGANISNTTIHFNTCNPTPKNVGIKLRGQEKVCLLFTSISCASLLYLMPLFHYCFFCSQIANYYGLYNSLILWSAKKWGCSGKHVTGLYHENEEGKLISLNADHDVLGVVENGME